MPIYLDEDMMGDDPSEIGFPHLLICLGLVCVTDDRLLGFHGTSPESTAKAMPSFANWLGNQGVAGGDIRTLYGTANLRERYKASHLKDKWKNEMTQIAGVLGFKGQVYGFDATAIDPKGGFYAEFHAQHLTHTCKLFYKASKKMTYTKPGGTVADLHKVLIPSYDFQKIKVVTKQPQTISAAVIATDSNKGALHEVDYALRLMKLTIP
jgi:hypothetical protein